MDIKSQNNIGRVKFYGKLYNGRKVDYGDIVTNNFPKQRFFREDIVSEDTLMEKGVYVNFSQQDNKLTNIKILREVGKIKWLRKDFDSNEVNFGVIELIAEDISDNFCQVNENGKVEIFFHRSQVKFDLNLLKQGQLVTFTIKRVYQRRKDEHRDEAMNLCILSEESDIDLIKRCVASEDGQLWKPLLTSYLETLEDIDIAKNLILEKIALIPSYEKNNFSQYIPNQYLLANKEIREIFKENNRFYGADTNYIKLLIQLIKYAIQTNKIYEDLLEELAIFLKDCSDYYNDIWSQIPNEIILNIWDLVPATYKLDFIIGILEEKPNQLDEEVAEIVLQILTSVSSEKTNKLLVKIPALYKSYKPIFNLLSNEEKINNLVYQFDNENNQENKEEIIINIFNFLKDLKNTANLTLFEKSLNLLHINISEKNDYKKVWQNIPHHICKAEIIWEIAPYWRKVDLILEELKIKDEISIKNDTIPKLIKLVENSSDAEKATILATVSQEYKIKYDKVFLLLSPEEQLKILADNLPLYNLEEVLIFASETIKNNNITIGKIPKKFLSYPSINSLVFAFPKAEFRQDHIEFYLIKNFVELRKIEHLIHLTTMSNFEKICESGAILSRQKIEELNIDSTPFDENRLDRRINHICCSISYYNFHMFYNQIFKKGIPSVLLYIKPDYLWKQGTLFSPVNAATAYGNHIKAGYQGLQSMFAEQVRDNKGLQTRGRKPDNLPTCIQAEVLVEESISLEDIDFFVINHHFIISNRQKERIIELTGQEHKVLGKPDWFKYRSEWIVKEENNLEFNLEF